MKRRRNAGFTLIEVLVAVAVLALAMGAIISGMARYTGNAAYLREKTLALWVAHNRLTELELAPDWPAVGKSNGEAEMAGTKWKWEVLVQKTQDDRLRRVDVLVRSPQNAKVTLAQLSGFMAAAKK